MCGRFTLTSTPEQLAQRFGLDEPPQAAPRYNIAPGQDVLAIRVDAETSRRVAIQPRWGLVPSWAKDAAIGARMINARAETVAEKPAFRGAFRARRCLVPADGFYEWATRHGRKQAHYIGLRDGGPFGFAGLWERWEDPSGGALESCTLLTRDAIESIRAIHSRMPVILEPAAYAPWRGFSGAGAMQLGSSKRTSFTRSLTGWQTMCSSGGGCSSAASSAGSSSAGSSQAS